MMPLWARKVVGGLADRAAPGMYTRSTAPRTSPTACPSSRDRSACWPKVRLWWAWCPPLPWVGPSMGLVGKVRFLNDRPIHPSGVAELGLALLVTGFPYLRVQQHDNLPEFAAFMRASQGVRRLGSAALDLCFVACGWTIVLLKLFFERWRTMSDRIGSASARPRSGPRSAARRLLPPFSGSDKAVSNTQDSLRHHALVKRPVSSASPRRSPVRGRRSCGIEFGGLRRQSHGRQDFLDGVVISIRAMRRQGAFAARAHRVYRERPA